MNRRLGAVVLLGGVAVAVLAAVGALTTTTDRPLTVATACHVAAGLSFIVVGLVAWNRRPQNRVGALMVAVGFAWYVSDLRYTSGSLGFSAADYLTPLPLAILGHLFIAFPSGRVESRRDRIVVATLYAWVAFSNLVPEAFLAPEGSRNLLAIHVNAHLHVAVGDAHQVLNAVLACVVVAVVIDHWRVSTPPGRRALAPVLWASGPVVVAVIALDVAGLVSQLDWLSGLTPILTPLAVMTLPFGFLVGLLRTRLGHRSVGGLVIELGTAPRPTGLREALARTTRDPSLQLAYWRPETGVYVDADGLPVELPPAGSGRATTLLERNGEPVAALVHDPTLEDDPWLIDAVSAAASMALENERLHADVAAQLAEVRASRARIVEAADAERRRLERDIHDGAQQRLVSLALSLRMARDQLGTTPEATTRESLDRAAAQLRQALAELRELAAGIHPAILTEGGLAPAIRSLAEQAAVPVTLRALPDERLPEPVEAAAYFVVCEALANVAKHASARAATVSVQQLDGHLVTEVADDGIGGADVADGTGLRGLADRLAAVDGQLDVISPPGRGTRLVATIPCV
jgi:signal transduction histidine kinase